MTVVLVDYYVDPENIPLHKILQLWHDDDIFLYSRCPKCGYPIYTDYCPFSDRVCLSCTTCDFDLFFYLPEKTIFDQTELPDFDQSVTR